MNGSAEPCVPFPAIYTLRSPSSGPLPLYYCASAGTAITGHSAICQQQQIIRFRSVAEMPDTFGTQQGGMQLGGTPGGACNVVWLDSGAALLDAAAEYSRRVSAIRMVLSTELTNTTAQALYEKLGWGRYSDFCTCQIPL